MSNVHPFQRVSARPASNRPRALLPAPGSNCAAGFSSGNKPDAVARRFPRRTPADLGRASHPVEDARDPFFWADIAGIFLIGCGTVAVMTAVLI